MNALPACLLYTGDADLRRRIEGFLHGRATVRTASERTELELRWRQHRDTLLFVDLRAPDCLGVLADAAREFSDAVVVALGGPRTDPGLRAAALGVYAIEPVDLERLRLQTLFDQAQAHLRLQRENRVLRESLGRSPPPPPPPRAQIAPTLDHFSSAFRRFDNLGIMLESLVEGVASCARVTRVAVFAITDPEVYRFRAGIKCLEETRALEFPKSHPFVHWLQLHALSLSRPMLRHIESVEDRLLLEKTLELSGAEAILPLFGRERLLGWLCLGRPSSGSPFEPADIEDLTRLAEQISVAIENSLLHESIALQKALAENLLQAIPVGIIASGGDSAIRWFNRAAERLLGVEAARAIGQPIHHLSPQLGAMFHRCLAGETPEGPIQWTEPGTRRELSVEVRCLRQEGRCMGALAVLRDLTEEQILREKQNNLERATFWNELASAISHEVRNPLVAISTFAQLLPERYADEEFRTQFRDLTTQEVARLNGMIDQLDQYANPPRLEFGPVAPAELLERARCLSRGGPEKTPDVAMQVADGLPAIRGDAHVLADALVRLLQNAFSAVDQQAQPRVTLRAQAGEIGAGRAAVVIEVRDNGPGIPVHLREKVFSPFCTTKARGVGLGLPVVRRTMIDHGGLVDLDTGETGTCVRLTLPAWESATEARP